MSENTPSRGGTVAIWTLCETSTVMVGLFMRVPRSDVPKVSRSWMGERRDRNEVTGFTGFIGSSFLVV